MIRERPSPRAITTLQDHLRGDLILPEDQRYDAARRCMNTTVDRYPTAIVRAADASDVTRVINVVREYDLPLAVRSGGHSLAGLSTIDGAILVDLSRMKEISIDPVRMTVRVQAGATSGDLAEQTQPHGLALSTGDTSSVGLGGLTLGGGIGWFVRKSGLTIDSLLAVELVTADGRQLVASADEYPDLFWALRGGGGNFGIATQFEFQLQSVGTVLGGALILPATHEVIQGYIDYAPRADEGLTTSANLMRVPPLPFVPVEQHGALAMLVAVCYTGPVDQGQRAIEPLRALATPIAEMIEPMPYPALFAFTELGANPHGATVRSGFVDTLPTGTITSILDAMQHQTSPFGMVQIRGLGGALSQVSEDATAFAHRDKEVFLAVLNVWLDPTEDADEHREWTNSLWREIRPAASGAYVNFLEDEGEARIREAYPAATFQRLAQIKRQYDPDNIFRQNQNIPPES